MKGLQKRQTPSLRFIGEVVEASEERARIRIYEPFREGLYRLEDISHLIVLYWLTGRDNESDRSTLRVTPKRHAGAPEMGVFGSRSPSRPNPIALCVVKLLAQTDEELEVRGLDANLNSPVVDIKPYIPRSDMVSEAKAPEWTLHGPAT